MFDLPQKRPVPGSGKARPQADAAEQAAWSSSGERLSCPQWHLLGLAIRSTLARIVPGLTPVIQAPKQGLRTMRHELADYEWTAISGAVRVTTPS